MNRRGTVSNGAEIRLISIVPMSRLLRPCLGLAFTLLLPILLAPAAIAALTIDVFQNGNDVVAIGYGTANTAALTSKGNVGSNVFIWPNAGAIQVGSSSHSRWSGMTGPANYGTGGPTSASTWSGSAMGRVNGGGELALPVGYVSGTAISATATWPNATLASLGATPGIYTWTWGSGPTADSMTINILAASPLVVTTTSDVVDAGDGQTSLREAILYANSLPFRADITFNLPTNDPGYHAASGVFTLKLDRNGDPEFGGVGTFGPSGLRVDTNVTIYGGTSKITIARDEAAQPERLRLFYVSPTGNLTLRNLTLSGGRAKGGDSDAGGGGAGVGGAIINTGTLSLWNCTVHRNSVQGGHSGRLESVGGGGLGGNAGTSGYLNSGGGPNGGAIFAESGGFGGGASYSAGNGGFGGGGALGGNGGTGTSRGGFGGGGGAARHSAPAGIGGFGAGSGTSTSGSFPPDGGGGAGLGGGIFNYGGTLTVVNSTLSGNAATGGAGSNNGSGLGGAIFNLNGTVTATHTAIADNIAPQGGGGIYSLGDNGISTQNGPTLTSTTSGQPATVTLNNSILSGSTNGAPTPALVSDFIQNTHDSGNGGGAGFVASMGANNLIQTRPASGNDFGGSALNAAPLLGPLQDNGGPTPTHALLPGSPAIDAGDPAFDPNAFTPLLTTDQRGSGFPRAVKGNAASASARIDIGAYELFAAPTFTTDALTLIIGSAPLNLAAALGVSPTGGSFSGTGVNPTTGTFDPTGLALGPYTVTYTVNDGFGGTNSATFTITVTETSSLTVTTTSDAVNATDGQTSLREALAYAATLTGPQTITFSNTTGNGAVNFHDGTARTITLGGTQLDISSHVTLTGPGADRLTISGNNASRIFNNTTATLAVSGLTLANGNGNNNRGGAIYSEKNLTLTDCRLTGNSLSSTLLGCALSQGGGTLELTRCTFSGNSGNAGGGAIFAQGVSFSIVDCVFADNETTRGGGAILFTHGSSGTISRTTFSNNESGDGGGALLLQDPFIRLVNCTFSGNRETTYEGGAIYAFGFTANSEVSVTNCTFVDNAAVAGGGIYLNNIGNSVTLSLANTILSGNAGGNLEQRPNTTLLSLGHNLSSDGGGGHLTATGDLVNTDPLLGPLQNNSGPTPTHALLAGSPAIDAGDPAFAPNDFTPPLATDQRGRARVQRGLTASAEARVDIGAYEAAAQTLFVDQSVSGGNGSGDSWANAMPELRTATALAQSEPHVTEIWVAAGTYTPAPANGDRNATFRVGGTLQVYGGFTSGQANLADRDSNPATNGTVLSGDLNGDDGPGFANRAENAHSVVRCTGVPASRLDGFTVTGGNANGTGATVGGGIRCQGGMQLSNLIVTGNQAVDGGGISAAINPTLTNVTVSGNSATNRGGGMTVGVSAATVTNATFSGNVASEGAGIYTTGNVVLTNVTFHGNSATAGGTVHNQAVLLGNGTITLRNCILWGNGGGEITNGGILSHSIVQGSGGSGANWNPAFGTDGGGNLDADPKFVSPITATAPTTTGNLRLRPTSPALNVGNNHVANPVLPTTDLDGAPRIAPAGGVVDMGAYERIAPPTLTNTTLTVTTGGMLTDLAALTGAAPGGGAFTGTGVSVDGNGKYLFDSTGLAPGTQVTITYTVNGPGGTSNSTTLAVTVTEVPRLTVTTTSDTVSNTDGQNSLREALAYAATLTGPQTVVFSNVTTNGATNFHDGTARTITLNGTQLEIASDVTVTGPGADRLAVSGNNASRVFGITGSALDASLSDLAIIEGKATDSSPQGARGGGIYKSNHGSLNLTRVVFTNNAALGSNQSSGNGGTGNGGAVCNIAGTEGVSSIVIFTDCVVAGNTARGGDAVDSNFVGGGGAGLGGAIHNEAAASGSTAAVVIARSTLTGNRAVGGSHIPSGNGAGGPGSGGGVSSVTGGGGAATVTVVNSTLSGNIAQGGSTSGTGSRGQGSGGAVQNSGSLWVTNSTFSGNGALSGGGGVVSTGGAFGGGVHSTGTLALANSTFTGNEARGNGWEGQGGGVYSLGSASAANTLIAGNLAEGLLMNGPEAFGAFASGGFNLVGDADGGSGWTASDLTGTSAAPLDPRLGPLANNGGPTRTHALLPESPAIDAGAPAFNPNAFIPPLTTDQRGQARVTKGLQGSPAARIDIGAYELFAAPVLSRTNLRVPMSGAAVNLAAVTGPSPRGGVFSGPGVIGGIFQPRGLPRGGHRLTYTVVDAFGIRNHATMTVTVILSVNPVRLIVSGSRRFQPTKLGQSSRTRIFQVRNAGGEVARNLTVSQPGPGLKDFIVSQTARRVLPPGAVTAFRATFRPRAAGERGEMVRVSSGATVVEIRLSGRGRVPLLRDPDRLLPKP